jgi:hypothetical protein
MLLNWERIHSGCWWRKADGREYRKRERGWMDDCANLRSLGIEARNAQRTFLLLRQDGEKSPL